MPCPSCLGDAGPDGLWLRAEERGTFDSRLGKEHETCGQFKRLRAALEDTRARAGDLPGRMNDLHNNQVKRSVRTQGGGPEVQVSSYLAAFKFAYTT
jgi:hypothetical protein